MRKPTLLIGSVLLSCLALSAQSTAPSTSRQVLPTSARYSEGSTVTALPFGSSLSRHVLYAYDGSTTGYSAPRRIGGIALRCDGTTPGSASPGTYNFTLKVSTGRNAVSALDPVFANNHGNDLITAFNGALSVPAALTGYAPNQFSLWIPFSAAFEWDPRNGPLLLDFAYGVSAPAFGGWDAESSGVAGLSANSSSATTATASLALAPVIEIQHLGLVSPSSLATVEGSTSTAYPFGLSGAISSRSLSIHDPGTWGFTGAQQISALAWRTDQGIQFPGRALWIRITLSTTSVSAASISSTFAANHGSDQTVVFDGHLSAAAGSANTSPGYFDLVCELQQSFVYDPASGGLVVDVQVQSGAGVPRSMDCGSGITGIGRVYHSSDSLAAMGTSQPGVGMPLALRSLPLATMPASARLTPNPRTGNQTSYPFNTASRSLQLVSAAETRVSQPFFVRHLRFRPSGALTSGPSTWAMTVDLSSAATTPANLSSVFDNNHGGDRRRVFDGMVSMPLLTRLATDPEFLIEIKLDEPFLWNAGTAPYLAVDLRSTSRTGAGVTIETTYFQTFDDGRITSTNPSASSGTTQNVAAVLQLSGEHQNGLATNYGAGCDGLNGRPLCATVGLPSLPNPDFRFRVLQAAGNAPAVLLLGLSNANIALPLAPGCAVLHGLELGSAGVAITDAAGNGTLAFALRSDLSLDGVQFRTQWAVLDSSANSLGIATSDAQLLTLRFF